MLEQSGVTDQMIRGGRGNGAFAQLVDVDQLKWLPACTSCFYSVHIVRGVTTIDIEGSDARVGFFPTRFYEIIRPAPARPAPLYLFLQPAPPRTRDH